MFSELLDMCVDEKRKTEVGFSGTRKGMATAQKLKFLDIIDRLNVGILHHGGCIGADMDAHNLVGKLGIRRVVHPPVNKKAIGDYSNAEEIREEKGFLDRNRDIVDEGDDGLIATPLGIESDFPRSGTWFTIRYAKQRQKDCVIIYLDGRVEKG